MPIPYPINTFRHNWKANAVESWEWLTDILTSYDDTESRICTREIPRRMLRFSAFLNEDQGTAETMFWKNQLTDSAVVLNWIEPLKITADISINDTFINVLERTNDLVVGEKVLAFPYNNEDPATVWTEISSFGVASLEYSGSYLIKIHLENPSLVNLKANEWILYPMKKCEVKTPQNFEFKNKDFASLNQTFELLELSDPGEYSQPDQYKGLDVFMKKPNRVQSLPVVVALKHGELDFKTGSRTLVSQGDTPKTKRSFLHWFNLVEKHNFVKFYNKMKGRTKPFYIPSWNDDFTPIGINHVEKKIYVKEPVSFYYEDEYRKDLALYHKKYSDGLFQWSFLEIDSFGLDGNGHFIEVVDDLSDIAPFINIFSWLEKVRFVSDKLEFRWKRNDFAVSTFETKMVKFTEEDPE